MTQLEAVWAVFDGADLRREFRLEEIATKAGLTEALTSAALSKLKSSCKILRVDKGVYRRASGVETREQQAIVSDVAASTDPTETPEMKRRSAKESEIRASERARMLERIKRARENGVPQSTKDWIAGFDAGVEFIVDEMLGPENADEAVLAQRTTAAA